MLIYDSGLGNAATICHSMGESCFRASLDLKEAGTRLNQGKTALAAGSAR